MYGTKLYGSPRSYRKRNKYKSKEVIEKDLEKEVKLESRQNIQRLTNADIEAFNSYQKLLLVLEDTEKSSLKSFYSLSIKINVKRFYINYNNYIVNWLQF